MGKLEELVAKSIKKVFREVFGNVVMGAIEDYLREMGLNLDDTTTLDIEKFHDSMILLFGEGAETLERAIVDEVYRNLGLVVHRFTSFVENIKRLEKQLR